jgi:hypothetical protein
MSQGEEEPFLNRWSRLKAARRRRPDRPEAAPEPQAAASDRAGPKLPAVDALNEASDFSVFMAEGVPEGVRRAALRRLWRLDPVLANLDGMNDYEEALSIVGGASVAVRTTFDVLSGAMPNPQTQASDTDEASAVPKLAKDTT